MSFLGKIFTWWNGATVGTSLYTALHGVRVGEDQEGNVYYRSKDGRRRWVIYKGEAEASRVPPEWHGWLHRTSDLLPDDLPPAPSWVKPHRTNPTGSPDAERPRGSLRRGAARTPTAGDYEAWRPESREGMTKA